MHVPPYHRNKSWQRFFAGVFFGAIISFCILLYFHGTLYERWAVENSELRGEISDLKSRNKALEEDKDEFDEKKQKQITVNTIEIHIENGKELRLDRLIEHQLEEMVKEEIKDVIGKDINNLAENDQLLISTVENKRYKVDDFIYEATVERLIISPTLKLTINLAISD